MSSSWSPAKSRARRYSNFARDTKIIDRIGADSTPRFGPTEPREEAMAEAADTLTTLARTPEVAEIRGAVIHDGAANFRGTGSFAATANLSQSAAATFAGTGSLTANAHLHMSATAIFAGSGWFYANA